MSPDLRKLALTICVAIPLLLMSSGTAYAWCIDNQSGTEVTARIWDPDGLYDRTVGVGPVQVCETILFMDLDRPLVLRVESASGFQGQVAFRAGGNAVVGSKDRTSFGVKVGLLYVESRDTQNVIIGLEPWWALSEQRGLSRQIEFVATADPQYFLHSEMNDEMRHVKATADQTLKSARELIFSGRRGVIVAGDLTQNSRTSERNAYIDAEGGLDRYFYEGLGNHDYDSRINTCIGLHSSCPGDLFNMVRDKKRLTTPTNRAGQAAPHYSWDWGDVHFVQLNLMPSDRPTSNTTGDRPDPYDALTFLTNDLAEHVGDSGRPVVVIHHYGFDSFSRQSSVDTNGVSTPGRWWDLDQRTDYWNVLAPYRVAAIVAGHKHLQPSEDAFFDWFQPSGVHVGPPKIFTFAAGAAKAETTSIPYGAMTDVRIEGDWIIAQRRDGLGRDHDDQNVAYPAKQVYFGEPRVTLSQTDCIPTSGMCSVTVTANTVFPRQDQPSVDAGANVIYEWQDDCHGWQPADGHTDELMFSASTTCHVTVKATNIYGGATKEAQISVAYVPQSPVLSGVPTGVVVQLLSAEGTGAYWDLPTAEDPQDGTVPVTCAPKSGSLFPLGTTTVNCTATDHDGNSTSAAFAVSVVDSNKPVVLYQVSPPQNAAGWNNSPVTVSFTIYEFGEIVSKTGCETQVISTDTNGKSITCTVRDAANNTGSATVVIKLDQVAPVVTFAAPSSATPANANGWYRSNVSIGYTITDARSGLAADITASGTLSFAVDGTQMTQIVGARDQADNIVVVRSPAVSIDRVAPRILSRVSHAGELYTAGWYGSEVTVSFLCSDSGSGIESCTPDQTLVGEGVNQSVTGKAVDLAGNEASFTESGINIDMTPPTVVATRLTPANANGWNAGAVDVSFTATDASGIREVADEPLPVPVPSATKNVSYFVEGANQTISVAFRDLAGNIGWGRIDGINIDTIPPVIVAAPDRQPNAAGWYNADVHVSYDCLDGQSGIAFCTAPQSTTGESVLERVAGRAVDLAGNEATVYSDFKVDKTAPLVTATRVTPADANGWNSGPVSAAFSAADSLSGMAGATTGMATIGTEGRGQAATFEFFDLAGNRAVGAVNDINIDLRAPVISPVSPLSAEATSSAGAIVIFEAPAVTDLDPAPVVTVTPPSGSVFPLGNTTVAITARDAVGHESRASFVVTVADTTKPAVTTPGSLTASATTAAGAIVSFTVSASDIVSGSVPVNCLPASGSTFGLGSTNVRCTAIDAAGNEGTGSFLVTVSDTTAPVVTVPGPVTQAATSEAGATVNFSATATDVISGVLPATCSPASGSTFAIGSTTVTCEAVDGAGNQGAASFVVTVTDISTPGSMRGKGFVRSNGSKYEFDFQVSEKANGERGSFSLDVTDEQAKKGKKDNRDRFVAGDITFIAFSEDPSDRPGHAKKPQIDGVRFSGVGTWNGAAGYRFEVLAADEGEPGRHRESIRITITGPSGVVATVDGAVDGGNVQSKRIHR